MSESQEALWYEHDPISELREIRKSLTGIVDLSMINPDLAPAKLLVDRLLEATGKEGAHRYAVSRGIRKLREAFCIKYFNKFVVRLDPETECVATFGSKEGLLSTLRALASHGATSVLLPKPTYPGHLAAAKLCGLEPRYFMLGRGEDECLENIRKAQAANKSSIVLLSFPNNPTGMTVSAPFWRKLKGFCNDLGVMLVNDFTYGEMHFGKNHLPASSALCAGKEGTIELYSMSKAYNIPGWRVAAALGDANIVKNISLLKAHTDYGLFLPIQQAAAAALISHEDLVKRTTEEYEIRASVLSELLTSQGFTVFPPHAGASLWVRVPENLKGYPLVKCLLQDKKVFVTPGEVFGAEFDTHFRIALVAPQKTLIASFSGVSLLSKAA
jgi:alanine-synthesizing transaminase